MYKDIDGIITDMGKVYEILNMDPECKELYNNIGNLSIQINFTDFNEWVTQTIKDNKCSIKKGKIGKAPVQEFIESDTFKNIFTGLTTAPEAALAGYINFEGDFSKMLLLQPLLEKTKNAYIKILSEKIDINLG